MSIDDLAVRHAEESGAAVAIADAPNRGEFFTGAPRRFMWQEVNREVSSAAARLRGHGVEPGSAVTCPASILTHKSYCCSSVSSLLGFRSCGIHQPRPPELRPPTLPDAAQKTQDLSREVGRNAASITNAAYISRCACSHGEIGQLRPIQGRHGETSVHQIGGPLGVGIVGGRAHRGSSPHASQVQPAHQPPERAACNPRVLGAVDVVPHLRRPVRVAVRRVHPGDHQGQLHVAQRLRRRRPALGCVTGGRGVPDAVLGEHSADRLDPEPTPVERRSAGSWLSLS